MGYSSQKNGYENSLVISELHIDLSGPHHNQPGTGQLVISYETPTDTLASKVVISVSRVSSSPPPRGPMITTSTRMVLQLADHPLLLVLLTCTEACTYYRSIYGEKRPERT